MAISGTSPLGASDGVDRSTYTTATLTPSANKLYLLAIVGIRSGLTSVINTPTGGGLTWNSVYVSESSTDTSFSLWRALSSSPGAGAAISIGFTATQNACAWHVWEFDGVVTSGSNGADAIVQNNVTFMASATSSTNSLSAFASGENRPFTVAWIQVVNTLTPEGGYTGAGTSTASSPNLSLNTAFNATTADTSPSWTWVTSTGGRAGAVEIAASGQPYSIRTKGVPYMGAHGARLGGR